jgi:hypothetical protein
MLPVSQAAARALRKKTPGAEAPGELNREASRLGDEGSGGDPVRTRRPEPAEKVVLGSTGVARRKISRRNTNMK